MARVTPLPHRGFDGWGKLLCHYLVDKAHHRNLHSLIWHLGNSNFLSKILISSSLCRKCFAFQRRAGKMMARLGASWLTIPLSASLTLLP